jgi:hypothetical protein
MFTSKDKIAKLQRLMKKIDEWNSERDLPPIFRLGKPDLSINSEDFKEWRGKVTDVITLIFGEHSRYIDDFNEIAYADILDHFSSLAGEKKTKIWKGLETARTLLQSMVDEINQAEGHSTPVGTTRDDAMKRQPYSSVTAEIRFGPDYSCIFKTN